MVRIPLVLVNGEIQQLQPGDDIQVPVTGVIEISLTNGEATPVVVGAPVYSQAASTFKKAKADAAGTSNCIGLVSQSPSIANGVAGTVGVEGIITLTTAQWDAVAGTTGGLTFNTRYYVSATVAGQITSTPPATVGQYVQCVGIALSPTVLKLEVSERILL